MTYTPKYPVLRSVRGFNDKPVPAMLDVETDPVKQDRLDLEFAIRTALGTSIYNDHSFDEMVGETGTTTGEKSLTDTLMVTHMSSRLPLTIDDAAVRSKSWFYSYLQSPYIETTSSLNVITFIGQIITVSNKGPSTITISRRGYDDKGTLIVQRPVTIFPSATTTL